MLQKLAKCFLFKNMTEEEIDKSIKCCGARSKCYCEDENIFLQFDVPEKLYVLLEGGIAICKDTNSGKRSIVTRMNEIGDIFGEVYLFLEKEEYDYYAVATERAVVLEIPKGFLYHTCANSCDHHNKLIYNMLSVLAEKAFRLNRKLQIMSSTSLRQKIITVMFDLGLENQMVDMKMSREEFADYIGVARPSLSRELMKMQDEKLIEIVGKKIKILNLEELEEYL